jgi:hypothetical protein
VGPSRVPRPPDRHLTCPPSSPGSKPAGAPPSGSRCDDDRELLVIPWHAPEGQRLLTARERLLISEHGTGPLSVHRLSADAHGLAERIRHGMRSAARHEEMSGRLST